MLWYTRKILHERWLLFKKNSKIIEETTSGFHSPFQHLCAECYEYATAIARKTRQVYLLRHPGSHVMFFYGTDTVSHLRLHLLYFSCVFTNIMNI